MQGLLPVLCFIAGFALAWLVLRRQKQDVETTLRALSAEVLERNQRSFADMAKSTLAPVRESLDKVDSKIQDLEKSRVGAYATLTEQIRGLVETQSQLRSETGNLVTALRSPGVRGRWGEMQLRRVVEMAGMLDHCDFLSQSTIQ